MPQVLFVSGAYEAVRGFIVYSVIFATESSLFGIIVPMQFEIPVPSGGAIILVASGTFAATAGLRAFPGPFGEAAA